MADAFRSLASILLAPRERGRVEEPVDEPIVDATPSHAREMDTEQTDDLQALLRDVRLFRARLAETLEDAVRVLLADIAADVVGRELELAPPDIDAIVAQTLRAYVREEPLGVHVHPTDAPALAARAYPVVADPALRRGDLIITLRSGELDVSLGVRLDDAVRRAAPV